MCRVLLLMVAAVMVLSACGGDSSPEADEALPTQMNLPTLTATHTPTITHTPQLTATASPAATHTPPPSPTATHTATAVTIPTATLAPSLTPPQPAQPTTAVVRPFAGISLFDGDPVPVSVPAGVTALAAVDAVTPHVLETAPASFWAAVSGSPSNGWLVEFYDEANDVILLYRVLPDGEVRRLARAAFGLMPGFPLARDLITVDSDRALELAAAEGPLPSGDILMELRSAGDDPAWAISGDDLVALVPATDE